MHNFETVLALLVGVTFLALVARRFQLPTPALLVVGGLLVAVVPGLPTVQFDPQLVFLIFVPPLLYRASLLASYRDVRANFRPILSLGVGHVLFATIVIAWVAHNAIPGLPWASAFALGAVVSPPDVAAATAFLRRLPMPRRVVTILEGESMINDAAAIVAYRVAVAAAVTGAFSLMGAAGRFVVVGTGGVLVGLAVGWLLAAAHRGGPDRCSRARARTRRGPREPGRGHRAAVVGLLRREFSLAVGAPAASPRAAAALAGVDGGGLGRPTGWRHPHSRRRNPHRDGRRHALPRPRRHHRSLVRRHSSHAARPRVHARAADAEAGCSRNG